MADYFADFETYLHDEGSDRIFKVLRRRKIFTPFEQEKKYVDEDEYTSVYDTCTIESVIALPNDFLIGLRDIYVETNTVNHEYISDIVVGQSIDYYLLSDLILKDVTEFWNETLEECGLKDD